MNALLYYIALFSLALAIHGLFFQFDLVSRCMQLCPIIRSLNANAPKDERFVVQASFLSGVDNPRPGAGF